MVVPYLGAAAMRLQHQQLAPPPDTAVASVQTTPPGPSSQQMQFIGLLQQAERRHRETLERAVNAENQVRQLRQMFQQWQLQLRDQLLQRQQSEQSIQAEVQQQSHQVLSLKTDVQQQSHQVQNQLQLIQQQHVHQQVQLQRQVQKQMQLVQQQHVHQQVQLQRQVQKQMQALHDAVLAQQEKQAQENQRVMEQLKNMYTFQQLQAFAYKEHVEQLEGKMLGLERSQRSERRNRQALHRQMQQTRRWQQQPTPAPQAATPACPCPDDDCCPCEFPEQCPFNPCYADDRCVEVPEVPDKGDCLLRNLRLGLVESSTQCNSACFCPSLNKNKKGRSFEEDEDGYLADDEASLCSDTSSGRSSSFKEERRQILQEVRNLENTRMVPRYKQIWLPLRCFRCGELGHLATFCENLPTTIL